MVLARVTTVVLFVVATMIGDVRAAAQWIAVLPF
ncbi:hypothetical protein JOD54_002441 [Actinokineospora baliensis]|nr:hypothetical protein [Actinokineospora baliensis]